MGEEEALAAYQDAGDEAGATVALVALGVTAGEQGDTARAVALLRQALAGPGVSAHGPGGRALVSRRGCRARGGLSGRGPHLVGGGGQPGAGRDHRAAVGPGRPGGG